ncbi:MAG: LamG-like jellyroll fold domain-containing protein [bacterium]
MHDVVTKIRIKARRVLNSIYIFFFTKKITLIKWQLNVFTVSVLGLGILIGGAGILPKLMALNETNFTIAQGGDSNFTLGTSVNTVANASNLTLGKSTNWFSMNWNYKKQLTIKNTSGSTLNTTSSVSITIDTSSLESVLANCNDIRVIYQSNTDLPITIKRDLGSTGCNDSKATILTFPIQANITSGSSDTTNYALYYGNSGATAQGTNGYSIPGGPQATMVCSFNGTTTCETAQTPSVATGALRYSTKSALSFNGSTSYVDAGSSSNLNMSGDFTVGMWINFQDAISNQTIVSNFVDNQNNAHILLGGGRLMVQVVRGGTAYRIYANNAFSQTNQWIHLVGTFSGTTANMYINGVLVPSTPISTAYILPTSGSKFMLGRRPDGAVPFKGQMDEVVMYDRALSDSEILGQYNSGNGKIIIADSNTKLIYHFDENGDDPRNTGKALDASGNGLNGTISNAKYVSGTIGIDFASTEIGKVPSQSYASHQGILVEEGTTNYIPNPSFESDITTSWNGKNTFNYTSSQTDADGNTLIGANNIKDVFYYDTTKDSDSGAWRNNANAQSKSWYTEAFSTTRGKKQEFPEKSYIVASYNGSISYLDVIDAVENKLWMRFSTNGGSFLGGNSASIISSVYALNGEIYIGRDNGSSSYSGLFSVNFKTEAGLHYWNDGTSPQVYSGTIAQRAAGLSSSYLGTNIKIMNNYVYAVHTNVISGKTYVAVGTDAGATIINETDGTAINSASVMRFNYVWLTSRGELYLALPSPNNSPTNGGIYGTYSIQSKTNNFALGPYYGYGTSTSVSLGKPYDSQSGNYKFFVNEGTSLIDGTSNTIYVASERTLAGNAGNLAVIQEKQGDESRSSVKFYRKDFITEEMYGEIRGMWPLYGEVGINPVIQSGASTNYNGTTTQSELTVGNATRPWGGSGGASAEIQSADYERAVRGSGLKFDGTGDYLKEKTYLTETGATWGSATNNASYANGQAFIRAGETLGSETVINGNMETGTPPSTWSASSGSTVTSAADQAPGGTGTKAIDAVYGGTNSWIVSQAITLTYGTVYKVTGWIKAIDSTICSLTVTKTDYSSMYTSPVISSTSWTYISGYFTSTLTGSHFIALANSSLNKTCRFDDISVKPLSSPILSSYKGNDTSATPFIITMKDSAGKAAWGYMGNNSSGETVGSELITNGTFDTNATGWTAAAGGTGASVAGGFSNNALQTTIGSGGTYGYVYQSITTVVGKMYRISMYVKNGTGNNSIYSGTSQGGNENISYGYSGGTSWTLLTRYFVANATTTYIRLGPGTSNLNDTAYFDEVSVKEVTDTQIDGVHIVSTRNGAVRNWTSIESGFNYNDTTYTFEVRKTDFQIYSGELSVGLWAKRGRSGVVENLFSKGTSGGANTGYSAYFNADNTINWIYGGINSLTSVATIADTNWHQYVFTSNGTTGNIYIDGALNKTGSLTAPNDNNKPFIIGANTSGTSNFQGTIDEPFIGVTAVTATQVADMYAKGNAARQSSFTQQLAGTSAITKGVWTSSDNKYIYIATSGANGGVSVIRNGKVGDYTDSDSMIASYTSATTPALLNNDTIAIWGVGQGTLPTLVAGSSANGVTVLGADQITKTRNTTSPYFKFGTASAKLDNSGSILDSTYTTPLTLTATSYTLSAYAYTTGASISNTDLSLIANSQPLTSTYTDMGGGWWRLTGTFTGVTTSQTFGVQVKPTKLVYIDGIQLERKAFATSYADGSLPISGGYNWTGTANNSNTTKNESNIQYSTVGNIDKTSGSVSLWVKPVSWQNDYSRIFSYVIDGQNYFNILYDNGSPARRIYSFAYSGGVVASTGYNGATPTISTNQWQHIVATWTNGALKIYVNNVQSGATANYVAPIGTPTSMYVGRDGGSLSNSVISDFRIYNQPLTVNQISDLYNQGLVLHTEASTNQQKYTTSGTWESPVINLNSNAQWGLTPNFVTTETLNGNTTSYEVRTSPDGNTWNSYSANTGNYPNYAIASQAQKYIQIRATLNSPGQVTTPVVSGLSIHYVQDTTAPITNAANTAMKSTTTGRDISETNWTNDPSPYFRWDLGADNVGGSGIKGYCLSLSQTLSDDPASQKGLLGTSPISTVGYTCQFIVGTNEIDFANSALKGNTWLSASNSPYYLNIKAIDNTGNTYPTSETFEFMYDDIPPTNVNSFSTPQNSFANVDDIYFNWPASGNGVASDSNSQLLGYQYSINSESNWTGSDTSSVLGLNYIPLGHSQPYYLTIANDASRIQMGSNTIYFRALDVAGNRSSISRTASVSYGGEAPKFTDGSSITITPLTSEINNFSVSWPEAVASSGRTVSKYYYMINTAPPTTLDTILNNSSIYIPTENLSIPASALGGVIKGTNTIYVVAIDDLNNYSGSNSLSKSFTLNSNIPDPVKNLTVSDASVKSASLWRASLAWEVPEYKGTGILTYVVNRSEDGINWVKVTETSGLAYVDIVPSSKKYYYRVGSMDNTDLSRANPSYALSVNITPKGSYTTPAELISNPVTSDITTKRAIVTWVTARNSDSKISYGLESGKYFEAETSISTQTTSHVIPLTNLQPSTTYYYIAKWTDEDGNTGKSNEQTFTTSPAPEIKDVVVKFVNTNSAQIQFTTKGASKVKIYYGKSTQFGSLQELPTSVNESKYTVVLDGLEDGMKYYYRINPYDIEDTEYEGTVLDLKTLQKPKVSDIKLQQIKNTAETSILISWTSNTEITSMITYYPEGKIEQSRDSVNLNLLVGSHQMTLTGLMPDVSYSLVVRGLDKVGNEARSDIVKFTTASDTRPPVITDLLVETYPSDTSATGGNKTAQVIVSWKTDEPATSQIEYGDGNTDIYKYKTPEDGNLNVNHVVIISNLEIAKIYHLVAVSKDKASNISKSQDIVTITANTQDNALDLILKNIRGIFNF